MLKNYIKIAYRNLVKHKLFSFINIVGLGIAIPFALLSLLQLQSSFEFDNWHSDRDRIYRITTEETTSGGSKKAFASSPFLLASELEENYPAIEKSTHVVRDFGWELNNRLKTSNVNTIFVDSTFFQVFNFPLETGQYPTEPNTIVLSHEKAIWFFGESDPIGKSLQNTTHGEFKIVGVLKEFKPKTQFKADVMFSMATYYNINPIGNLIESWASLNSHTFVKFHPKANPADFQKSLLAFGIKISKEYTSKAEKSLSFNLQQFKDISPAVERLEFNPYVEDMQDIYFNFSIPLMILLLAGFNYTNLTLARSLNRAQEVGVRKVMGAKRFQLIFQFLAEAVIVALLALGLGFILLNLMKEYIHVQWITWKVDNTLLVYVFFVVFAVVLGAAAGIFPALILSRFEPVKILKGSLGPASFGKFGFRKVLTVVQFAVTLAFVFQIGHMYNQFNYMAVENDNFNRKGIYNLSLLGGIDRNLNSDLSQLKEVKSVGYSSQTFGNIPAQSAIKADKNDENIISQYYAVDNNFISSMNLKFIAGTNIPNSVSDSASSFVVVNRNTVKRLRLRSANEAIGKILILNNTETVQIQGVVEDFCNSNYQAEIIPIVMQYNPALFNIACIQTQLNIDEASFEASLGTIWKGFYPFDELVGSWLSTDLYERYYPAEDMKVMAWACGVIFLIGMMGLLGILTYTTEKRVKEVSIRKVMGATTSQIIKLLSWSFIKLLMVAVAIAVPIGLIAGYIFTTVLFKFHNGVNYYYMGLLVSFIVGAATLVILLSSYKSAEANPTKSLSS